MSFPNSIPGLLSDFRFWNNFGKFRSFARDFSPLSLFQTKQLQLCQSLSGYEFLMLIPLQLHDDVTLAIYNLQGNLELANNDRFG